MRRTLPQKRRSETFKIAFAPSARAPPPRSRGEPPMPVALYSSAFSGEKFERAVIQEIRRRRDVVRRRRQDRTSRKSRAHRRAWRYQQ
ncbi:hypothetical protein [Bradyrhizobium cytisi]|uniref:Uncharacterized protein n=1 Tax=Bradyrhizobium cytisi TaxID=515489 RepID=A0A5S4X4R9_9BRAD|nr:hypothetical protein [Bradyrhizobium cytisi]TYL87394.1 hypothetical protein FXB38_04520 [Bradyrhizobium cytisi]